MALRRPEETHVSNATELTDLWRDLMGRGAFARRTLWMIFLDRGGRLSPVIVPIDDIPERPDSLLLGNLMKVVADVVNDDDGSAAFLLSRPGWPPMTDEDRDWARALRAAAGPGISPWPIHLATRDRVQVFAPDDLLC